ncbi:MAG TPA: hypothetical protein VIU46_09965 [Gallionellaceae bacterium]
MWTWLNLAIALAMAFFMYDGLHPEWWGWLLFSPMFIYMAYETVRKAMYSLTVEGDLITVRVFKSLQYPVSGISAVNVWTAKGRRIAVIAFADGRRFNFPSMLKDFDELVRLLRTKANLPEPD